jgi:hypothetical protein
VSGKSFDDAKAECELLGGQLAVARDSNHWETLQLISSTVSAPLWVLEITSFFYY